MPYVQLRDPWGMCYHIATRRTETTLLAWLDEILPVVNRNLGERGVPAAVINIHPMWEDNEHPDWLTDTRSISRMYEFPARTGIEGLELLARLRQRLERELV